MAAVLDVVSLDSPLVLLFLIVHRRPRRRAARAAAASPLKMRAPKLQEIEECAMSCMYRQGNRGEKKES